MEMKTEASSRAQSWTEKGGKWIRGVGWATPIFTCVAARVTSPDLVPSPGVPP